MSIASVTTMGYSLAGGFAGTAPLVVTLGYGQGATPPVPVIDVDTHDGERRRRRFREQNEERKLDVIAAYNRVFGLELPEETPAPEVVAAVEARVVKPKRGKDRELLRMAQGLKAMLADGDRVAMEMQRMQDEEDFILMTLASRRLH